MKKYKQPVIKAIELNSEQAILEVCKIGGAYMVGDPSQFCVYRQGLTEDTWCVFSARGKLESGSFISGSGAAPS
ncbi:MAG: hypothetical protein PHQ52_07080 [Candidatus Omnitrophica bacterium]|nr:hypothetical protein [Candidatus Omnitrophota bacterium]